MTFTVTYRPVFSVPVKVFVVLKANERTWDIQFTTHGIKGIWEDNWNSFYK